MNIEDILRNIKNNCDKEQYWNAIGWTNELQKTLCEEFDKILRRKRDLEES